MITISNPASKTRQTDTINQASKKHQALNFEKTRKQLRALSNKKLLSDLENLDRRERRLKILVLLYLAELDSRRLYLPLGFSSLFDYCTGHLGYTRATAARRIRAARTCAKYPAALDMLRSGEINITTLSMISDILDLDNNKNILAEIRHKSTRQVEMLLSTHRPVSIIRDSVRPVCVRRQVRESESLCGAAGDKLAGCNLETGGLNLSLTEDTGGRKSNKLSSSAGTNPGAFSGPAGCGRWDLGCDSGSSAERNQAGPDDERRKSNKLSSSAGTRIILEHRLKLGFSVSPEFMIKYDKVKSLLSNKHPGGISFEMLFEITMNEFLEKHDPERKRERRLKRIKVSRPGSKKSSAKRNKQHREPTDAGRSGGAGRNGHAGSGGGERIINNPDRRSRHIPPAVRDRVYARDKGRCTFVGANGKRCNATWDLEIDHVVPFARGGDNSPENLRLLCRKHNIYQAEKIYGREYIKTRSG